MEVEVKKELIARCTRDLEKTYTFLNNYLVLANLHNTNFIISDYWSQVPDSFKSSLEALPAENMSGLLLKENWALRTPPWKEESQWKTDTDTKSLPREMVDGELQSSDPDLPLTWHHKQLDGFMADAASCHLDKLSYPQLCEELYKKYYYAADARCADPFVSHAMGEKKGHEVELMAAVCSSLLQSENINHVVDLGSGKGYLATTLAMQYRYNVIGIDSQEGNTHGAIQRKQRLEKQYTGLVRRQKEIELASGQTKMGTRSAGRERRKQRLAAIKSDNTQVDACVEPEGTEDRPAYTAITAFIGPNDHLDKHVGPYLQENKCMLTGLHTCGNLAVSTAKLFLRSPSCNTMLNVGCCYHHIDEMYCTNPFKSKDECDTAVPHFPMSTVMVSKKAKLGRNCRMLSMQAMEKSAENGVGGGLDSALFWRALLQKILLDVHGYWRKDWIVGKLASKCSSFNQYVEKAFKKLKVANQVTDEEINVYMSRYGKAQKDMSMFFQLRTALSPAIETVILLDRCLYLLEQEDTNMVLIKKLFNPVQSPRCYGIIAVKREKQEAD